MNTVEELLKDRWEVIADYPQNIMPVGSVFWMDKFYTHITAPSGATSVQSNYYAQSRDKYPKIYRKLFWWEHRKESEMPEFLKHTIQGKTTYHKIVRWDMSDLNFITGYQEDNGGCNIGMWHPDHTYQPATKKEYEDHLQYINKK